MFGVNNCAAFAKVLLVGVLVLTGATAGQAMLSTDGSVKFTGRDHNNTLIEPKGLPETRPGDDEDDEAGCTPFLLSFRQAVPAGSSSRTAFPHSSRCFLRPVPRAPPRARSRYL